jgi:predicted outer membrane protein
VPEEGIAPVLPDTNPLPRATVVLAALTGLTMAALAWLVIPAPRIQLASSSGWTHTAAGPVGPTDRALLVTLRQDGLWEVPVGQQAQDMAVDPAVRQVGAGIATDLSALSEQVRAVADRLGVLLPSQPNADQQTWLVQIAGKSGQNYDRAMVTRLRLACADSLATITRAASATRNEQVRQLADQAATVVGRHIRDLDTIQLVAPAAQSAAALSGVRDASVVGQAGPDRTLVALAVLAVFAAAIAVLGLIWLARFGPHPSRHWWRDRTRARWQGRSAGPRRSLAPLGPRWPLGPRRPLGPPPPVELGPSNARRPW